jgi:hypothetical protein
MSRTLRRVLGAVAFASLAACSQAYSDRAGAGAAIAVDDAPAPAALGPYTVEVIGEHGGALPTFDQQGRFYVQGEAGDRYIIRVTNPTDARVEAVVTVDGLDVIDGEPGDLRKRGYVVQPHGELRIEGFRTSTSEVATFRFSSVGQSYAARKGKARNVGVIAVAIFEETAPQQIILDEAPPPPPYDGDDGYYRRGDAEKSGGDDTRVTTRDEGGGRAARRPAGGSGGGSATADAAGEAEDMPSGGYVGTTVRPQHQPPPDRDCCGEKKQKRPGLGTEYGEQRHSAASWTRFVRASDAPAATAELRYNDAAGLAALGILVQPEVDPEELHKRETADPFPGDPGFARPPAGIR